MDRRDQLIGNRYDMLCFEGISLMLNIFNGKTSLPKYKLATPLKGKLETMTVHKDVSLDM